MTRKIQARFDQVSPDAWASLARQWLHDIENGSDDDNAAVSVVKASFFASPTLQWGFIDLTLAHATTDTQLAAIAAGPIQQLLTSAGPEFIDAVEAQALAECRFARALTAVWGYESIRPDVRERVSAAVSRISQPIPDELQADAHDDRLAAEREMLRRLQVERERRRKAQAAEGG